MPRSQRKPFESVLEYFRTADITEATVVHTLVTQGLKERQAAAAAAAAIPTPTASQAARAATASIGKPKSVKGKSTAGPKAAPAQAAADKPARRKPGPKPGSHRRKVAAAPAPAAETEQPLAFEPAGDAADLPGDPGEPQYAEPEEMGDLVGAE